MLPQYWLEVRAILLRNDDRLIVQPKLNMKNLGVISAAIWARVALVSQTIYVRCFDYRKRACSCRRWTRRLRSTRGVAAAAWLRRRVPCVRGAHANVKTCSSRTVRILFRN